MRVAFDTSSTRGLKTGIGIYTENLIEALKKYAPEIEIVELERADHADQRTPSRILREQIVIPRLAAQARAGILHLTGFAAPWRTSCPVVLNAHDLVGVLFSQNFPPVARIYWSRYLPFTLRFARRLIVLSNSTKSDVERLTKVPAARIHVIPPGRDERFYPIRDGVALKEAGERLGLGRYILFVSTLEPRKGVDTLIAAFARIANQIPEDLLIVGRRGWNWETFFRQVTLSGVENRVRFMEYVPQKDLMIMYNLARVFVYPSRYEGFGLTPLEAMASGAPVISSNSSSLPEVVGDAGFLVPPDDVEGFARAIVQVTQDEEVRSKMRERGLRQADKFSWERTARATVDVYESIMTQERKQ